MPKEDTRKQGQVGVVKKKRDPRCDTGKWAQRRKPAVFWWSHIDPYRPMPMSFSPPVNKHICRPKYCKGNKKTPPAWLGLEGNQKEHRNPFWRSQTKCDASKDCGGRSIISMELWDNQNHGSVKLLAIYRPWYSHFFVVYILVGKTACTLKRTSVDNATRNAWADFPLRVV